MAIQANLTRSEAAERLRVSIKTIDRLGKKGEFDRFRVGAKDGSVRLTAASVSAYELRQLAKYLPQEERFAIPLVDQARASKAAARAARPAAQEKAA